MVRRGQAERGQSRQTSGAGPGGHPGGRRLGWAAKGRRNQVADLVQPGAGPRVAALARARPVQRQHRPDQRAADRAVRGGAGAADRAGQPMHRAKPGVGQGKPAAQADKGQIIARRLVLALLQSLQGVEAQRQHGPGQGIGVGGGVQADIGFDHLHHRIQPRGERHLPGAAVGQVRIDDGQPRQHPVIAQTDLAAMLGQADDGVSGRLGAGARRRRQRDKGQWCCGKRQAPAHHLQMVHRRGFRGDQRSQRLGHVQHRPATQSDHHLRRKAPCLRQRRIQHRQRRLARAGMAQHLCAPFRQPVDEPVRPPPGCAMDHQNPVAMGADQRRGLRRLAPPEQDQARTQNAEGFHSDIVAATARPQPA